MAERTSPEDTIFICGTEAQFLYHARRKSASRFISAYPLGSTHPRALEWQKEAMADVTTRMPVYIVTVNLASSMLLDNRAPRYIFEHLSKLLAQRYEHEAALVARSATRTELVAGPLSPEKGQPVILSLHRLRETP